MIISPLKAWVQNVLPVVYDDSLSYLEIVAKIIAKTNEIIEQTNENTNAIEQLADVISELGDIDELKELLDEVKNVIENLYTDDNPLMDGTASAGSANHAARSDHVHPSDTSKAPVNHASDSTDYGVGSNSNYGHVKITNDITDTNAGVAATPSAVKSINDKLSTYSKDNLIENGYLCTDVINQRGQSNYSLSDGAYGIDRWKSGTASLTLTLGDDGLTLTTGSTDASIRQSINKSFSTLSGKRLTYTILYDGGIASGSGVVPDNYNTAVNIISLNEQIPNGIYCRVRLYTNSQIYAEIGQTAEHSLKIIAVKLEIGDIQTLAHKEVIDNVEKWAVNDIPNQSEELLKCQRYFQIFRTQANRPTYGADFRPTMATNEPVLSSFVKDDTTYYTASSEP